jgi:hypothetical protein
MKMKKLLYGVLFVLVVSTSGCAAWFEQLRTNPVAGILTSVNYIQTALSLARSAFEIWATTSGAPDVELTRARFNALVTNVDRALFVVQDGLRLAAHAGSPAPDVRTVLRDAQQAIGTVHAFLAGLPGNGPGRASHPSMRDALDATELASRASFTN